MRKSIVVIPTYNEAENLTAITAALFALPVPDLEILIVDDASPDGTGPLADQLASQYPGRFHVMHRSGKQGLGTAYVQGFQWAIQNGATAIIQMDADFSHSPDYLPQMLALISDYDVVVGSRYVRGGKLDERWPRWRRFLSWWANSVWVHLILGTRTQDATAGFKCWRASALPAVRESCSAAEPSPRFTTNTGITRGKAYTWISFPESPCSVQGINMIRVRDGPAFPSR